MRPTLAVCAKMGNDDPSLPSSHEMNERPRSLSISRTGRVGVVEKRENFDVECKNKPGRTEVFGHFLKKIVYGRSAMG